MFQKIHHEHGAVPTISKLEQTLQDVEGLYAEIHHDSVDNVESGQFIVQRGTAPTISELEQTLQ